MRSLAQKRDQTVKLVDGLVKKALRSLHRDLPGWYRREQEVVSLFAFGHLVPLMQKKGIDLGQLCIEGRVRQVEPKRNAKSHRKRRDLDEHAHRDLVLFSKRHTNYWSPHDQTEKDPIAIMEWKLWTPRGTQSRSAARCDYKTDVLWLTGNAEMMKVGYGVFVELSDRKPRIECARIAGNNVNENFFVI